MYHMINEYKVRLWCHKKRYLLLGSLIMYQMINEYSMKFIIVNYKFICNI